MIGFKGAGYVAVLVWGNYWPLLAHMTLGPDLIPN